MLSRIEANLDGLMRPERPYISAAGGVIHRRVIIRAKLSLLMANYSKIKRIELMWSCIGTIVGGNWNLKNQKDIEKLGRRTEKLRSEAARRLDEDNMLESKTTQDHHLCLQPGKRLETQPLHKGEFPE